MYLKYKRTSCLQGFNGSVEDSVRDQESITTRQSVLAEWAVRGDEGDARLFRVRYSEKALWASSWA